MNDHNYQHITVQISENIAHLSLSRAPVNVLHIPMLEEIELALHDLAAHPEVRMLVLRAAGKLFSAGVDIADHTREKVGTMIPLFNRVCVNLADFPVPTLAAVHGHALGGGCELVLCCDMAVMTIGARIGQPEIQLAAIAPVAAMRLKTLIGYRAAADMLFTGKILEATEALSIGLINAVVASDQLEEWIAEKTGQITSLSRAANTINKRSLSLGFGDWKHPLAEIEKMYLDELMATQDAAEGLQAFIGKRPPQWTHK